MKVEYLKDGSNDCPLIRLFDFQITETEKLKQAFENLANGTKRKLALQEVIPVQSINISKLVFTCDAQDKGVTSTEPNCFVLSLTPMTWKQIVELTEPFCMDIIGFQWLCRIGDIKLLLSPSGNW